MVGPNSIFIIGHYSDFLKGLRTENGCVCQVPGKRWHITHHLGLKVKGPMYSTPKYLVWKLQWDLRKVHPQFPLQAAAKESILQFLPMRMFDHQMQVSESKKLNFHHNSQSSNFLRYCDRFEAREIVQEMRCLIFMPPILV